MAFTFLGGNHRMMNAISGSNIRFAYEFDGELSVALDNIDITIERGKLTAVLGHNGCGKSTLAKHFNALLRLQQGELTVCGINAAKDEDIWLLRRLCGMVFQNPDNQFVSPVIEEDIAFGLENYEVPRDEIPERVEKALLRVDMEGFGKRNPQMLSGGQKQRIALAGVLALEPEVIIFDEVTAMLDPVGRKEVLNVLDQLREQGKTLVMITHYVDEAVMADCIMLMSHGKLIASGTPREILTDPALLQKAGLVPPVPVRLYYDLKEAGINLARCPLTHEEFVEEVCRYS